MRSPQVEAVISSLSPEQLAPRLAEALTALEALTDPEGHIWHGDNSECTGECAAVRKALEVSK